MKKTYPLIVSALLALSLISCQSVPKENYAGPSMGADTYFTEKRTSVLPSVGYTQSSRTPGSSRIQYWKAGLTIPTDYSVPRKDILTQLRLQGTWDFLWRVKVSDEAWFLGGAGWYGDYAFINEKGREEIWTGLHLTLGMEGNISESFKWYFKTSVGGGDHHTSYWGNNQYRIFNEPFWYPLVDLGVLWKFADEEN